MVTDNERRKVAQKLRELEIGVIGTVIPTGKLAKNILNVIGYSHSNAMTPYGLLADLIEPQSDENNFKPDNTFQGFSDWFNEQMGGWDKW